LNFFASIRGAGNPYTSQLAIHEIANVRLMLIQELHELRLPITPALNFMQNSIQKIGLNLQLRRLSGGKSKLIEDVTLNYVACLACCAFHVSCVPVFVTEPLKDVVSQKFQVFLLRLPSILFKAVKDI
jgi:hypothetical protein